MWLHAFIVKKVHQHVSKFVGLRLLYQTSAIDSRENLLHMTPMRLRRRKCVFVRMLPYPLLFRLQVVALMRNVPMLWLKVPLRG